MIKCFGLTLVAFDEFVMRVAPQLEWIMSWDIKAVVPEVSGLFGLSLLERKRKADIGSFVVSIHDLDCRQF
jgi:hypothetical protein